MTRFTFATILTVLFAYNAFADEYNSINDIYETNTQYTQETVYRDIPVQSYFAYPDDQNFIPETEFMNQKQEIDYDQDIVQVQEIEQEFFPGVQFATKPMVICRNFACTKLNDKMTKAFLFNSLANIFNMNSHSRLYMCEADPFSRDCLQSGISFPVRVGIANALVKIPKATISQSYISTGMSTAYVNMTYNLIVNGIEKKCNPTEMGLIIPNDSQALLSSGDFSCRLTSDGPTNISLMINLDYIDLDYGIMGGYYSVGVQGSATGGGNGYTLLKTEYSSRGISYNTTNFSNTDSDTTNPVNLRPGEYSVEPLK